MFGYYLDLALRSLKRNRMLTALMVLAIAVGIGASMTTLTVMHLLSGNPLPGRSDHLFRVQLNPDPTSDYHGKTPPVMDDNSAVDLWSAHRADRQALIVQSPIKVRTPDSNKPPLMLSLLSTTSDFFPMFDVPFQYGRGWSASDDANHARVAVISSELNQKLFGGANSVGHILRVRESDLRIIGVLAPWQPSPVFYSWGGNYQTGGGYYGKTHEVFAPYTTSLEINDGNFEQYNCWHGPVKPGHLQNSACIWVGLWVELDSTAKVADFRRFLSGYAEQQKALGRFKYTTTRMRDLMQWLDYEQVVPTDVSLQTWLAFSFLLICLFNTVGLLLAKFLRRSGEIGVRRALGASRGAVFTQCLVEAGMIGLVGGIGGWLLTLGGLWLVRRQPVAYADLAHLDVSMFLMTFVLSIVVSLIAGALPALRASRVAPALQLKTL